MDSKHLEEMAVDPLSPGIKATPSPDDSDTETVFNNSHHDIIEMNKKEDDDSNTTPPSTTDTTTSSSSTSSGTGGVGVEDNDDEGFVSGEEDFEMGSDRHAFNGTLVGTMEGEEIDEPMLNFATPRAGIPIAKLSLDDDDYDDVVGGDDIDDNGDGVFVGIGAPKIRVSSGDEEVVDEGSQVVDGYAEGLRSAEKGKEAVGSEEDKPEIEQSNFGDDGILEEKDGETLGRDGNFDIGATDETKVSPMVKETTLGISGVVESTDVKFTSSGDPVVDIIHVDVDEASRSGAAIIVQVGEHEVSETKAAESVVVEKSAPVSTGAADGETDESNVSLTEGTEASTNESVPLNPGPVETDGVKFTDDGVSVVDAIDVDFSGAIRSGTAVVGGQAEGVKDCSEKIVNELGTYSDSVELDNESEPLVGPYSVGTENNPVDSLKPVTEYSVESAQQDSTFLNSEAVEQNGVGQRAFSDHGTSEEVDLEKVNVDSLLKKAAISGPIKNVGAMDGPPLVLDGNEDVMEVLSRVDGEEIGQMGNADDITQTNSVVSDGLKEDASHMPELQEESALPSRAISQEILVEAEDEDGVDEAEEEGEIEGSATDGETEEMIFGSSAAARQFMEELQLGSGDSSLSGPLNRVDGQIATDSDEEPDSEEEGGGEELFDSAALAALLKAARNAGSDSGPVTITSQDGSRLFTIGRPAGLGPSLRSARTASRPNSSSIFTPPIHNAAAEESLSEEEKKKIEKIQELRVKFLRLVHRLGHSAEDTIAAQVLYRLALLAGRPTSQIFSLDQAKQTAMQLEAAGKDDLNFSLNILVVGKTGVGKSATINSILGEEKVSIDAFERATTSVKEINGVVDGVKIRFFDTPGLKSSGMEQGYNSKLLASAKKFTKNSSPDIVLYVDRLDSQTRDLNDLPLLRTITSSLGSSVWRNAIVTLTHAASAPPDGPTGSPLSYEAFVAQRSHIVQQYVGQAVGEMRLMNPSLMNPVSLVENHPACRKNRDGHKVLPNGQTWRPQLLLLCYSMKILSEASSLSKPQDPFDPRKLFGIRARLPSLPYFLSSLLQSRAQPKLPADQGVDIGDSDIDLADFSDSDVEEEEDEYDQLPPFKPLRNSQVARLSKEQRRAYFEEYDYRVKLLQKKQWKEELKRMRELKKTGKSGTGEMPEDFDQENGAPATVQVPIPDMVLPPSFDGDNPAYRYRFLEPKSQLLARPVLDSNGWDHDCGYDGVNVEANLGIAGRFPSAVVVQVTKDKKEFNIHLDSSVAAKHGENGSSVAGFDIQAIGKQLAYILRGETKFKTLKKNKTAAGVTVTFLGENVATGVKLEDQLAVGKRLVLVCSTGTVRSQREAAYGANLEVRLRAADFPIGQDQSSFVLSLIRWRGDLALGANLQSQFSIGRGGSKMAVRLSLNNKCNGQITVRTSRSDHLNLALAGLIPIAAAIYRRFRPEASESHLLY